MSKRISQQRLESYLWGAAVLLRGTIDAGDYKQFIFPLLFYKRLCDVFDEETETALAESGGDLEFASYPENHRFQIPREAHWKHARQATSNVGRAIQSAMRTIEKANPETLYGIFGDAQWTNKERLSDAMLRDLIEHFSTLDLRIANLPEDELGQGYEYLIKKFADDSGHTAAEFYTNRTVVHLMTEMLEPQPGESVYDPTCGSGGMLLSCIAHLQRQGQEWRNVRLYGQERNLMTSSIARMNCFLHGIEDFQIVRGDTLSDPKFVEGDRLKRFDLVLANPPYSIKQWDRDSFASDQWGRNLFGTPPQGRADYAFWQHIICSLAPKTGRCAILFPHGVLFRQEESQMRQKLIEADLIECVLGLGPNLFYNSAMEACIVICRNGKPKNQKRRILFINAINEVTRERTQSFLTESHVTRIAAAYHSREDVPEFAKVASLDEIKRNDYSLKIDLYVPPSVRSSNGQAAQPIAEAVRSLSWWKCVLERVTDMLGAVAPELSNGRHRSKLVAALTDHSEILSRKGWEPVRFGEIVRFVKDTVDRSPGDRYIAGDHMDTESVHLRRWGTVGDGYLGPAFVRKFRKGQVLYGSRRTYLKKIAVADFDGITANTTFVLEALTGTLDQRLLPWLMLCKQFTEHSIRESKGSTNPYINYPDIAKFTFDCPPLAQQQRIAELIWSIDAEEQQKAQLSSDLLDLQTATLESELEALFRGRTDLLSNLLMGSPGSGNSAPPSPTETGHYVLSLTALSSSGYTPGQLKPVAATKEMLACRLKRGDFLISRSNTQELVGFVGIFDEDRDDVSFPDTMMRLKINESLISKEFLQVVLLSRRGREHMMRTAAGTSGSMKKINRRTLGTCVIPTPSLEVQARLVASAASLSSLADSASSAQVAVKALKSAFIDLFFGEGR